MSIPCFGIISLQKFPENNREDNAWPIVLEQIVITCSGIFYQFRLKNDILKNGTSHIGLYESAPLGFLLSKCSVNLTLTRT